MLPYRYRKKQSRKESATVCVGCVSVCCWINTDNTTQISKRGNERVRRKQGRDAEMDAPAGASAVTWGCLHTEPVITWNSFSWAQSGRAEISLDRTCHNCLQHHSTH